MKLKIDTLGQKIGMGYSLLAVIIALAVGFTLWQVKNVQGVAGRITDQRVLATRMCLEINNGINHSVAALRGYVLLKDPALKRERQEAWSDEINASYERLRMLSKRRVDSVDEDKLEELQNQLNQLENYQDNVEELAVTNSDMALEMLRTSGLKSAYDIRNLVNDISSDVELLMRQDFEAIDREIANLSNLEWVLLGSGFILSVLLGAIVSRSITRPVAQAAEVADNIAAGDLDTEVEVRGSRELRDLGAALLKMRNALKERNIQAERHQEHSTGLNALNKVMEGNKGLKFLTTDIITFLAERHKACVGTLSLKNESETFHLAGSYAFKTSQRKDNVIKPGEGVAGQVALTLKPIIIEAHQAEIKTSSSIMEALPSYVYVAPLVFENEALGIIELGKFEPFTEVEQQFLATAMEIIAIALDAAVSREQIDELLAETQRQSEELQAQQEELQQSNEELEEQTTKLKEQQEELQAANEELEEQAQIVAQKNADLETARQDIELKASQLEISSKYKSEFLANMSHELRTPLNSLLILSNDLAENRENNLTPDQVESADVIVKSGKDLLALINDILDLSKVEAGKLNLSPTQFKISELSDSIKNNFMRMAIQKGIELKISIDEDLPENIKTDRQRIDQIIKNLVSNALKFTHEGHVAVNFTRDAGDFMRIAISDTGIGIPKEKQQVIFEAFQQVDGSTARKYGGTGLGLSISRELARILGGKITISSVEGEGSTFTLIIPIEMKEPESTEQAPAPSAPSADSSSEKLNQQEFLDYPALPDDRNQINDGDHVVLVIEDDLNFARILTSQAKQKGLRFLSAATGEDGLKLAEQYQPQAIILDLDLPGMNGHLVLKTLKSNPSLRHIPVHIMSVNEQTLELIKAGAVEYLTKPVSKDQLEEAFARIEDFINRKMKNLLILEDNDDLRRSIVKLIGNGDVKCFEAGTAAEALDLFKNQKIDCMVMDIGLPDINGFDLIKRLEKEEKKLPPIIVYTGKELTKQENDDLQQYAETIIVKGVKSEERLLDETALFLHRMVKNLPPTKQQIITGLYDRDIAFNEKKILLVDDDMRNVWALSKILSQKGFEVLKADNGKVALSMIYDTPAIDIVLMDIMMPEMDGYECMRAIRSEGRFRDLPIIALTAKSMKEDRQLCIEAGANDYITKPVDVARLLSLIHIWIKK
ncbi:response regulator [Fulvivirga ulvae]|uniref:response regulator n=1 Tax=Fulvivirga ulvae TaxID=2904245 RepID=UPI001F3258D4|nr:response regulator [Fulvivirga ulvae]UII31013.1 response regulator [Fulvivirga ulvae]